MNGVHDIRPRIEQCRRHLRDPPVQKAKTPSLHRIILGIGQLSDHFFLEEFKEAYSTRTLGKMRLTCGIREVVACLGTDECLEVLELIIFHLNGCAVGSAAVNEI